MTDASRRGFLVMTGAGAAAVAAGGVVVIAEHNHQQDGGTAAPAGGPMVAWIGDTSKPEITIMVDEREVVVTDADLVAKLAAAAGRE